MKLLFSIRDNATETYTQVMFMTARGEAMRMFKNACQDENSMLNKNPEDFDLYLIGTWDEQTGEFTNNNERIIRGIDVIIGE